MSEYDIQADIARLRTEIQTDRLATAELITKGFSGLHEKMEEHIEDDNAVERRVGILEDRQSLFGKLFWGMYISGAAAVVGWLFRR